MNKILIFAGAKESELLIEKIAQDYLNLGEFHIIHQKEIKKIQKEGIHYYKINFYAFTLYKTFLTKDFNKIIILIKNKEEAKFVLNKIKHYKTPILFVKFWVDFEIPTQNNIEVIDQPEIITNKIIDFLPGVPLFARDIGLGKGEIIEVEIPIHSPFAYKNINIFKRYNIRAVAIYRNNELKFVDQTTTLLPNDKVILIGDPKKIKEIFYQIKTNIGAFPEPYGKNIYLLIDMKLMDLKESSKLLKAALFLHRKLKNKKLIIKIINPSLTAKIYKLYKFPNIEIETDFFQTDYEKTLKQDLNHLHIGLVITNSNLFFKYSKTFINAKKPILKIGKESIKKCKSLSVILNDKYITKIAPTIFDLSYQLGITIKFFNIDPETNHKDIVEYLQTIAKSFRFSKIEFIKKDKQNPIAILKKEKESCLVEAISKKPPSIIKQILFPQIENSYIMLKDLNQFLIPIKEENDN